MLKVLRARFHSDAALEARIDEILLLHLAHEKGHPVAFAADQRRRAVLQRLAAAGLAGKRVERMTDAALTSIGG